MHILLLSTGMRKFYFILLVLSFAWAAQGQFFSSADTLPNVAGYKSATVKQEYACSQLARKNEVTGKYFFDKMGNTISFLSICDNKPCGKNIYAYSNNLIISFKGYNSWTSLSNDLNKSKWESTVLSNEILYKCKGNKLISSSYYTRPDERVFVENNLTYDAEGRLFTREIKTYYDSFTVKHENVHYAVNDRMDYSYKDTITSIKYYRNNELTGTEEVVSNKSGNVLKSTLKIVSGKILKQTINTYNSKMQVVEIDAIDTGYDGFGNPHDMVANDKTLLKYDEAGKLISKQWSYKNKICVTERYEYSK